MNNSFPRPQPGFSLLVTYSVSPHQFPRVSTDTKIRSFTYEQTSGNSTQTLPSILIKWSLLAWFRWL